MLLLQEQITEGKEPLTAVLCVYQIEFAACTKNRMAMPVHVHYNSYFAVTPISLVAASPAWRLPGLCSVIPSHIPKDEG